jgi:hypothetical protein
MRGAPEIKAQEEAASERRLEQMWHREYERQRALADEQAETKRREKRLVRAVLVIAALIILIIIVATIALNLQGEAPAAGFRWLSGAAYV